MGEADGDIAADDGSVESSSDESVVEDNPIEPHVVLVATCEQRPVIRFPIAQEDASVLPHVYTLESGDGSVIETRTVSSDARLGEQEWVEIVFDLPSEGTYRLRCHEGFDSYSVFDDTTFDELEGRWSPGATEIAASAELIASAWYATGLHAEGEALLDSTNTEVAYAMSGSFVPVLFQSLGNDAVLTMGGVLYLVRATIVDPATRTQVSLPSHNWTLLHRSTGFGKFAPVASGSLSRNGKAQVAAPRNADGTMAVPYPAGQYALGFGPQPVDPFRWYVEDGEIWLDLDESKWVRRPDRNGPCVERRRLVRIPRWDTVWKAERGGFPNGPPGASQFASKGWIDAKELPPPCTSAPICERPLDAGMACARVKFDQARPLRGTRSMICVTRGSKGSGRRHHLGGHGARCLCHGELKRRLTRGRLRQGTPAPTSSPLLAVGGLLLRGWHLDPSWSRAFALSLTGPQGSTRALLNPSR